MLAGVRNVAWGAAMAMAGFLAVALADSVLIILFFSDARFFFFGPGNDPSIMFGNELSLNSHYGLGPDNAQSLIGFAVVIWLIGRVVRRARYRRA